MFFNLFSKGYMQVFYSISCSYMLAKRLLRVSTRQRIPERVSGALNVPRLV